MHETRLSGLIIHLLCLITIFALGVLKLIPVPVLYGVFLFMGLVSLGTNQFWGRMLMFFMQPSKYPVQPYTQYMDTKRMHLFTSIQLFFFALLYTVKSIKTIAIAFPICIALCVSPHATIFLTGDLLDYLIRSHSLNSHRSPFASTCCPRYSPKTSSFSSTRIPRQ